MALQSGIPVSFEAYFPVGAFAIGEVTPVIKWEDGQPHGRDLDKNTGHPLWQVRVIDADPDARKGQNEITVKLASVLEPQLPPEANGLPFRPVVFDGLFVTPYIQETGGRPRVAFSLRAREMKAPSKPRGGE
ncbi:plasmid replication, integration and excision activator [Microbacterium lacticum]|uniref:Plasmid replication, integration and excision activator n=1 Tax=Microbacterium lacticum TaxID=33885 RepID=A0A4Y3UPB3_9MICO|nr:plasmid replication, integration and excision activator [Microbacterium lacticum]TQM98089.1 hypothetical protein FHX68_2114 [Microbacterium lacticum]GEB95944.1 hypothetical protein MLA01_21630 [Microbacterium lacticum]GGI70620.1 hypothetical protein GCM10009724_21830 [Microbacterium lacticum]